tara:strand:- start:200 stop:322 length:123 start_codon:yes stop_codon:yes gene_type:complete
MKTNELKIKTLASTRVLAEFLQLDVKSSINFKFQYHGKNQ